MSGISIIENDRVEVKVWNIDDFRKELIPFIEKAMKDNYKFFKFAAEVYSFLKAHIKKENINRYKFVQNLENDSAFYECTRCIIERNVYVDDDDILVLVESDRESLIDDIVNLVNNIMVIKTISIELTEEDRIKRLEKNTLWKDILNRLIVEHVGLSQKIIKLEAFMAKQEWFNISEEERDMLVSQRKHMGEYANVLRARICWYKENII